MTKMPLGLKMTQMQLKNGLLTEIESKTHISKINRLRGNFEGLNRVLTLEMTKMPLGAKLTQKMTSNAIFKMDFDIE
jgi:hypothetical protein